MGDRHPKKRSIPLIESNQSGKTLKYINPGVVSLPNYTKQGNESNVLVSIFLVQYEFQCFSNFSKPEMKSFWSYIKKVHSVTWQQLTLQAGNTGFGFKAMPSDIYPSERFKLTLDPDVTFYEMRINQKMRIHGFRENYIFHVCWLDKDHKIFPNK